MNPFDAGPLSRLTGRQRQESERPLQTQKIINHMPGTTTIGATATTIYTVPSDRFFIVEEMTVTNVTAGTETYTIYFVESGGTPGTSNAVVYQEQVAAASSLKLATVSDLMLDAGGTIQVLTSNSGGINVSFWGAEILGT